MAQTSLQKSHSKASNAKLTLLCLLTAIVSTSLWAGVAIIIFVESLLILGIAISAISLILTFLCI